MSAAVLAGLVLGCGQTGVEAEKGRLFGWFDTLGFEAVATGQFGEVDQWYGERRGAVGQPAPVYGFLVKSQPLTVLGLGLRTFTLPPRGSHRQSSEHWEWKPVELKGWLADRLKEVSNPPLSNLVWTRWDGGPNPPDLQLFVLSRAASAHGLNALADRAFVEAERHVWAVNGVVPDILGQSLHTEIPRQQLDELVGRFRDTSVPFSEMLSGFEAYAKRFPDSRNIGFVRDSIGVLKDQTSERPALINGLADRTGGLIEKLQEQYVGPLMDFGDVDVFRGPRGEASPAAQLAQMGYGAVPRMIEALGDRRFSRCLRDERLPAPQRVVRVGAVAFHVLERIACRTFQWPMNSSLHPDTDWTRADDDATMARAEELVKAWWAEASRLGERETLVRGVRGGSYDSAQESQRLVAAYPDVALAAVSEGVRAASQPFVRGQLVRALAALKDPGKFALAREQMTSGRDLNTRLAGAAVLEQSDPDAAVQWMISEWRRESGGPGSGRDSGWDQLCQSLVWTGRPAAVEAAGRDLGSRPVWERSAVIMACEMVPPSPRLHRAGWPVKEMQAGYLEAIEKLLAGELTDMDRVYGMSGGGGGLGHSFSDPRICDMAGAALAGLFPREYRFEWTQSRRRLENERVIVLNVWRQKNGLAAVPVPPIEASGPASGACLVREVRVIGESAGSWLADRVRALRGTRLSRAAMEELFADIGRRAGSELKSFALSAYRDDDMRGFELVLDLANSSAVQGQATATVRVREDGVLLIGESTSSSDRSKVVPDEFYSTLGTALSGPGSDVVEFWVWVGG